MAGARHDIWSEWLLKRRFGGHVEQMKAWMEPLHRVRDEVLKHADLRDGETLLDVGCGDGLIAFGALEKSDTVRVIFADISQTLLSHAHAIAQEKDVLDRCQFVRTRAENLSITDNAVDIVTTRSELTSETFWIIIKAHPKRFGSHPTTQRSLR